MNIVLGREGLEGKERSSASLPGLPYQVPCSTSRSQLWVGREERAPLPPNPKLSDLEVNMYLVGGGERSGAPPRPQPSYMFLLYACISTTEISARGSGREGAPAPLPEQTELH